LRNAVANATCVTHTDATCVTNTDAIGYGNSNAKCHAECYANTDGSAGA
jgi:hypothetical protein